jgi:hypothetical protein
MREQADYPDRICNDFGRRYGKDSLLVSTYHKGRCGWCGEVRPVTEPRDFTWPVYPPPPSD